MKKIILLNLSLFFCLIKAMNSPSQITQEQKDTIAASLQNQLNNVVSSTSQLLNKTEEIKKLLDKGADINGGQKINKYTNIPLHWSINNNQLRLALFLLSKGASPNIQESEGNTSLHILVKKVAYLNPKLADLYSMQIKSLLEILKLLIAHGARLDIKNDANETPLEMAKKLNETHPHLNGLIRTIEKYEYEKAGLVAIGALSGKLSSDVAPLPEDIVRIIAGYSGYKHKA
ncbi:hypothetical protein H0X48_05005 [Candidatus Dependentiae bacterium]|nr:hypothetical protein [Candidatus Dependentiae bacterium]